LLNLDSSYLAISRLIEEYNIHHRQTTDYIVNIPVLSSRTQFINIYISKYLYIVKEMYFMYLSCSTDLF